MLRRTVLTAAAALLLVFLLLRSWDPRRELHAQLSRARAQLDDAARRESALRDSAAQLQLELAQARSQLIRAQSAAARARTPSAKAPTATPVADDSALLSLHSHWDWRALAREMLQPFAYVTPTMVESAAIRCFQNGTMYCARIQVVSGELYLTDYRAVFFDRHYAPARIIPMLEIMRRHKLPDLDFVVAAVDEPRVKTLVHKLEWGRLVEAYPGGNSELLPPPLFSSTVNRAHLDLPWPDFSFFMPKKPHKLRTPPWEKLHAKMLQESASVAWESKIELAVHTGNVGSSFRKKVAAAAEKHPGEMLVNELFIGDHARINRTCEERGLHRQGGYQRHLCYMTFVQQCSYKYLLNSASIGYANKFKYLLLCGSVVIYIEDGMQHKEFYEYGLVPGVHYVTVPTADDVPAKVRWLREHDGYARSVAAAGRARMAALDVAALSDFFAELLRQYARKQVFRPAGHAGAVRLNCEDDLWRHYALERNWLNYYKNEDNGTCIHPIPAGERLSGPGWGGAYRGSKARCVASHDLRESAQPGHCDSWKPGRSSQPFDRFPAADPRDPWDWASTTK